MLLLFIMALLIKKEYTVKCEIAINKPKKVVLGMEGNSKYPMNLMNLFMDNLLGKDLEISLSTLKNILEK